MTWTQPICDDCWAKEHPDREPVRMLHADTERCAFCGETSSSGIYIRVDPRTVRFPADD